jgi:hypothetical protein
VDGVLHQGARLLGGGSPLPVEGKALVADAIRCGKNTNWPADTWTGRRPPSTGPWVSEIGIVIEGELLTVGGKTLTAKPGDMVYFQKGPRSFTARRRGSDRLRQLHRLIPAEGDDA